MTTGVIESLTTQVAELTGAVRTLIEQMRGTYSASEPPPPPAKTDKPAKAAKPAKVEKVPELEVEATDIDPKEVKARVDALLKANKRTETIALLNSFKGAKSASGITEQGQDVMSAFIAQADELLMSA